MLTAATYGAVQQEVLAHHQWVEMEQRQAQMAMQLQQAQLQAQLQNQAQQQQMAQQAQFQAQQQAQWAQANQSTGVIQYDRYTPDYRLIGQGIHAATGQNVNQVHRDIKQGWDGFRENVGGIRTQNEFRQIGDMFGW